MTAYDAVLLAGGRAERLGGVDKPALEVGGVTLLDRVLATVAGATRRIVVGPGGYPTAAYIRTGEQPPGGGPVAAVAAGLDHVSAPLVIVLAADLPFLTSVTVDLLLAAVVPGVDAAVLVDDGDRDQLLVAAWRTAVLRSRIKTLGDPSGQPARRLFETVAAARVPAPPAPGQPPPWLDCDTEDELRKAREWRYS
ncbi:MAG: molybdopterin-guanine dinucleotide synthase [Pseudonocardiales bacterium]|nr:MAG: molybdopterin-guanine dinucleotide synthase [Pseudonocardiales bacterium]